MRGSVIGLSIILGSVPTYYIGKVRGLRGCGCGCGVEIMGAFIVYPEGMRGSQEFICVPVPVLDHVFPSDMGWGYV